jgi:Domain of unknown function (DUF5667)
MKRDNFDDILNECIDRLLSGESVEQCLQSYPDQSQELEPLLRSASATQQASFIRPDPQFKAEARYNVLSKVQADARKRETHKPRRLPVLGWQPRWAVAVLVAFLLLFMAGSSTVAASNGSMPDDTLYTVKLKVENVRLRLARSDEAKAKLNARFAERRVKEIIYLAERDGANDDNTRRLETAKSRLRDCLQVIEQLAIARQQRLGIDTQTGDDSGQGLSEEEQSILATDGKLAKLREILQQNQTATQNAFQEAEPRVPLRARAILRAALQEYQQQSEEALKATGDSDVNGASDSAEDSPGTGQAGIRDRLRQLLQAELAMPTTQ